MQKLDRRRWLRWLKIITGIYIAGGIALYFLQDKFLFHPVALPADHVFHFEQPFEEINLPVSKDKNLNIVRFTVPDSACRGVVLYFHGNIKNVERYAPYARNFTIHGYEVWIPDYPGFGKTTGKLTEKNMYEDAMQVYKLARSRFSKDSIIIYGKSLGTGVAAQLAAARDCRRVMLETPYLSIDDIMRRYAFIYPVGSLAHYHFPVEEYIAAINAPVTLFHGTSDDIIPFRHSKRLLEKARTGTELVRLEKGEHNGLDTFTLYRHKLDSLLRH